MSRVYLLLLALSLTLGLFILAPHTASAENGVCIASPASGPVGTVFQLTASGFDPNANLWLYAVEPGGTAFSDPVFGGFGGGARSNANGVVSFSFNTYFHAYGRSIGRALGQWTLVAQQTGPGGVTLHQANCVVQITSGGGTHLTGALLTVNPVSAPIGKELTVLGSGFAPNEIVNLWVTPPPGCSGYGFELDGFLYLYTGANAHSQADVKTDREGNFVYLLPTFSYLTCPGQWAISAYAPGSHAGGIATYELTSYTVGNGALLTVTPSHAFIRGSTLYFSGSGYSANGNASCWETRPDGSVRPSGTYKASDAGIIAFTLTTGLDDASFDVHYSEGGVGVFTMTCRDNATRATGQASYTLTGMVTDP